ncbi:MAG: hypothetical protein KatS3mg022_1776 [Armatimonadota bacterium]|nr:MAG: hypothetical protein KatS3mg022_1776 [Armatimonadota bacterium]
MLRLRASVSEVGEVNQMDGLVQPATYDVSSRRLQTALLPGEGKLFVLALAARGHLVIRLSDAKALFSETSGASMLHLANSLSSRAPCVLASREAAKPSPAPEQPHLRPLSYEGRDDCSSPYSPAGKGTRGLGGRRGHTNGSAGASLSTG